MEKAQMRKRRTWYGLNGTIVLGRGFFHRVGFGKWLILHPPLVNLVLRRGLEDNERNILSFAHEFDHLQTAPFALLYFGVILGLALNMGRRGLVQVLFIMACAQAAWEIASEFHAIKSDIDFYRDSYRMVSIAPRAIFWVLTSALAIAGWSLIA
jgi:hypothetical protein